MVLFLVNTTHQWHMPSHAIDQTMRDTNIRTSSLVLWPRLGQWYCCDQSEGKNCMGDYEVDGTWKTPNYIDPTSTMDDQKVTSWTSNNYYLFLFSSSKNSSSVPVRHPGWNRTSHSYVVFSAACHITFFRVVSIKHNLQPFPVTILLP